MCGAFAGLVLSLALAASAERTVPVVVAVDARFRGDLARYHELAGAVAEANRALGARLGMSFALSDVVSWNPRQGSVQDLLDDLRAQAPPGVGRILAGLTGLRPEPADVRGLASYREALLVVSAPGPGWRRLFLHELAHLFGAVHLEGEHGLMAERDPGPEPDALSLRLLELNRERRLDPRFFPLADEDLDRASVLYREALPRAPVEARAYLAQIAIEQGDNAAALETADALVGLDPGNVEGLNLRGIALRRLGRFAEAATAYQGALARRPRYATLHFNLAIALDRLGELDRAAAAYGRAVELDPGHVSALSNLARLLARHGDATRAVECAQRALAIAPGFSEARVNLAMALLAAEQPAAAEQEARRAVAERARLAEAHEALGAALLAQGRPHGAASSFETAAQLAPEEPRLRHDLAVALQAEARLRLREGDAAAASAVLERASRVEPENADVLDELATLLFQTGRKAEALEAHRRLLERRPDDATAHNNLAVLLFREGDIVGARRHVEEARRLGLTLHPDFLAALAAAERR